MSLDIITGQGGWLREMSGPDTQGRLGELWTGADALRSVGVPVDSGLLPALRQVSPEKAAGGRAQARDESGKFA